MLELPEAANLARQLTATLLGKKITGVIAAHSPHKFAWYEGDPQDYPARLRGKTVDAAQAYGGMLAIQADDATLLFADGVGLRFLNPDHPRPAKHQLRLDFADGSALSASVQMYGGLWCFINDDFDNMYYQMAREKPSPLSADFTPDYFDRLVSSPDVQKLSLKAFLATEQRIPGLGNGVLQDILWKAGLHPKTKLNSLSDDQKEALYYIVKAVLAEMTELGGRDTEKDLFGHPGGYKTVMSKNGAIKPCPVCGGSIKKEAYMGGSIYYCAHCQPAFNNA